MASFYLDQVHKSNAAEIAALPFAAHQCGTTVTQKAGDTKRFSAYFNAGTGAEPAYAPLDHASQIFADGEKGLDGGRRYARIALELMYTHAGNNSKNTETAKANISPYEAETLYEANQMARFGMLPAFSHENDVKVMGEGTEARYTSLVIRYQPEYNGKKSMMPWYVAITNGTCTAEKMPTGQTKAVAGTMQKTAELSMNISCEEFGTIFYSVKLCLENFAAMHYPKMMQAVEKLRTMNGGEV